VLVEEALVLLKIRCLVLEKCVNENLWFCWAMAFSISFSHGLEQKSKFEPIYL
jgi:hypothetical protein